MTASHAATARRRTVNKIKSFALWPFCLNRWTTFRTHFPSSFSISIRLILSFKLTNHSPDNPQFMVACNNPPSISRTAPTPSPVFLCFSTEQLRQCPTNRFSFLICRTWPPFFFPPTPKEPSRFLSPGPLSLGSSPWDPSSGDKEHFPSGLHQHDPEQ